MSVHGLFGRRQVPPLRVVDYGARSLRFPLLAARAHAENGEFNAVLTAWADALYVAWDGRHEQLYGHEIVGLIRAVAGPEWTPPAGDEAA